MATILACNENGPKKIGEKPCSSCASSEELPENNQKACSCILVLDMYPYYHDIQPQSGEKPVYIYCKNCERSILLITTSKVVLRKRVRTVPWALPDDRHFRRGKEDLTFTRKLAAMAISKGIIFGELQPLPKRTRICRRRRKLSRFLSFTLSRTPLQQGAHFP